MWYMRQKEEFGEDRSQGIRFYDNTQTCDYLPHWHMPYEVIMVIAEDLTVIVENERHLLHPGDIMVIPSGVVHEIHTPPTGHRYYFLLDRERLFIIDGLLAVEEALQPCMVIRKGSAPEIEPDAHRPAPPPCAGTRHRTEPPCPPQGADADALC